MMIFSFCKKFLVSYNPDFEILNSQKVDPGPLDPIFPLFYVYF